MTPSPHQTSLSPVISSVVEKDTQCERFPVCSRYKYKFIGGDAVLEVKNTFSSMSQNGSYNTVFELENTTLPCWLRSHLELWWTWGRIVPDMSARIVYSTMDEHTTERSEETTLQTQQPLVYEGIVRFDRSPCRYNDVYCYSVYLIVPFSHLSFSPQGSLYLMWLKTTPQVPCM